MPRVYQKIPVKVCLFCLKEFKPKAHTNTFCSYACMGGSKRGKPIPHLKLSEDFVPKIYEQRGYLCFKKDSKKIMLHRHVMEQYLGRPLTEKEVVHHIDGDRFNNEISNLQLCSSQAEHYRLHHPRNVTETHAECLTCKQMKPHDQFIKDPRKEGRVRAKCKSCSSVYEKTRPPRKKH
jgi:HNH endonuclease